VCLLLLLLLLLLVVAATVLPDSNLLVLLLCLGVVSIVLSVITLRVCFGGGVLGDQQMMFAC
jgi:hypothetical protein